VWTHIRVKKATKEALHELKRVMAVAFKRDFSDDEVIRELIRSKIDLRIDVNIPKEWLETINRIAEKKRGKQG